MLDFNDLYIKKSNNVESINKFGLQYGISANILFTCKDIYKPYNYNIKIYLLDSFKNILFFKKNDSKKSIVVDVKTN